MNIPGSDKSFELQIAGVHCPLSKALLGIFRLKYSFHLPSIRVILGNLSVELIIL